MATNPYGYGQAPGQSNLGYYEQQTGGGTFAAAERARNQNAATVQGPASTLQYGQQAAGIGAQANPYLGQTTQQSAAVGQNAYAGQNNPYLQGVINSTTQDATQAFQQGTMPQMDAMLQRSGSFGNTGVEQARQNAYSDFGRNLSNAVGGLRFQDYTQQQQLEEANLNRQQQNNQFNSNLNAGDLNRNMQGQIAGQGLALQGAQSLQNAAQFDANLKNNAGQFNAGQQNQMNMFNANSQNQMNQFNAGQANSSLLAQAGLNQNMNQYNQNMDFNTWQANTQNMRNGQNDQLNMLDRLVNWQNQGVNAATNTQNTPMNYWQQFSNTGAQLGGLGGTQSQQLQGNPWLSGLGGAMTAYDLYGKLGG